MWSAAYRLVSALRAKGPVSGARIGPMGRCNGDTKRLLARLLGDEAGMQIIIMALLLPFAIGTAALATDGALWGYSHLNLQAAADSAAVSVGVAFKTNASTNLSTEADAIAAKYGITSSNGTATVYHPPQAGTGSCDLAAADSYIGDTNAFEVIVTQNSIPSFFSSVSSVSICSRAIAHYNPNGGDCMLATGSGGITFNASNIHVNIENCGMYSNSNINLNKSNETVTVTNGGVGAVGNVTTSNNDTITPAPVPGMSPVTDPYATAASSWPTSCSSTCTPQTVPPTSNCTSFPCTLTLQPGVYSPDLSNNVGLAESCSIGKKNKVTCSNENRGITYSIQPGVYWLSNNLTVNANNVTLTGTGVTIILTGNSVVNVNGNSATFNITAPSSGWNTGLAFWEPTSTGTNGFGTGNGATMDITGAIYIPDGTVQFSGNAGSSSSPECTQIVASAVTLDGSNINFASGNSCSSVAGAPSEIYQPVVLVE